MTKLLTALSMLALLTASAAANDPFEVTTPGVPGIGGVVPTLVGEGSAAPNSANMLHLSNAAPRTPAILLFSMSELAAPFAGGVLGPAPDFIASVGATTERGALKYRFRMPPDAPTGLALWMQMWLADAGAATGLAASNTLKLTIAPAAPAYTIFPAPEFAPSYTEIFDVALGDLNADGRADMVVVNHRGSLSSNGLGHVEVLLAADDGALGLPAVYPTGTESNAVAIGDLDGDGALDLAVANRGSNDVSILFGYGDGTFEAAVTAFAGAGPWSIGIGDFDGDDIADLAVANVDSDGVSILRGLGARSFAKPVTHAVGDGPRRLDLRDLDADGNLDVVVACAPSNALALLLGTGDGDFQPVTLLTIGGDPHAVVAGDIDRDGVLDLVAPSRVTNSVSVLRGLGGGGFGAPAAIPVGIGPLDIDLADLNDDGWLDIATANILSNTGSVLLGIDGVNFAPATTIETGEDPRSVVLADLDGTGSIDMLIGNSAISAGQQVFAGEVLVLRGRENGDFVHPLSVELDGSPSSLVLGDINEDGIADLVIARFTGLTTRIGDGSGSFAAPGTAVIESPTTQALVVDIDGDSHLDIVAYQAAQSRLVLLRGDGLGGWAPTVEIEINSALAYIQAEDVNGDGAVDLLANDPLSPAVVVLLNDGLGNFSADPVVSPLFVQLHVPVLAPGDFDGDGIVDLAAGRSGDPSLFLLRGVGDGSFVAYALIDVPDYINGAVAGDLDGDGNTDLVVTYSSPSLSEQLFLWGGLAVAFGAGDGSFGIPEFYFTAETGAEPQLVDVNADGLLDVVAVSQPDSLLLLLGTADGNLSAHAKFQGSVFAQGLRIADLDGDALPDLVTWSVSPPVLSASLNQHPD